jgi:hypothetical protein
LSSSGRLAVDGCESTAHTDIATAGDADALGDAGLRILTNAGTIVGPNETPGKDEDQEYSDPARIAGSTRPLLPRSGCRR